MNSCKNLTAPLSLEAYSEITRHMVHAVVEFPKVNWIDAVSYGQLDSKIWLVEFLAKYDKSLGNIWIAGGWVGMLSHLLLTYTPEKIEKIFSIDIDLEACRAADRFLYNHVHNGARFAALNEDVLCMNYHETRAERVSWTGKKHEISIECDTIINTSWEHFDEPEGWFSSIPDGKLVVIQANTNWNAEGHVSCPNDLEDLCRKTPFSQRVHADMLPFGSHARLMTAGYK